MVASRSWVGTCARGGVACSLHLGAAPNQSPTEGSAALILSLASSLKVVFTVFTVFWVAVVIGTYFVVGALMKRAERAPEKHGSGPPGTGH